MKEHPDINMMTIEPMASHWRSETNLLTSNDRFFCTEISHFFERYVFKKKHYLNTHAN